MPQFTLFNAPADHPSLPADPTTTGGSSFTLATLPGSDLWRTPAAVGNRDDFTGTIYATPVALRSFKKIAVTVSSEWAVRYAQGGLVFFIPGEGSSAAAAVAAGEAGIKWTGPSPKVWVKTGIEFENGTTFASVVAANPLSDWSLVPWKQNSIRIELVREEGALWVYGTGSDGERLPLRQLTWAFDREEEQGEVWVGVLTAMPLPDGSESGGRLEVKFENLVVETVE